MTITTKHAINNALYKYSTDVIKEYEQYELVYLVTYHDMVDFTGTIDADEDDTTNTVILTPRPGRERVVRKFIALGRLQNPDFPFKLHSNSE